MPQSLGAVRWPSECQALPAPPPSLPPWLGVPDQEQRKTACHPGPPFQSPDKAPSRGAALPPEATRGGAEWHVSVCCCRAMHHPATACMARVRGVRVLGEEGQAEATHSAGSGAACGCPSSQFNSTRRQNS